MRSSALKKGLRTGVIFGVVILTMFLIGFTVTGAGLVGKLFGAGSSYSTPSLGFFIVFMVLIGMWAGLSAARRSVVECDDTLNNAIVAGTAAGFISGLFAAVTGLIFGTLIANKIDPRTYLPSVSPESVKMFLFNQSPLVGSLILLVLMILSGLAGAVLSFFLRNSDRLKSGARKASNSIWDATQSGRVMSIKQNKYARVALLVLIAIHLIILPRTWGS